MAQGHLITVIRHGNMVEQASVRSSSADFTESQLNHFDASRHPGFCVFFNFLDHDYQFSTIVPISFPQTTSIKAPGLVTSKTTIGIEWSRHSTIAVAAMTSRRRSRTSS